MFVKFITELHVDRIHKVEVGQEPRCLHGSHEDRTEMAEEMEHKARAVLVAGGNFFGRQIFFEMGEIRLT